MKDDKPDGARAQFSARREEERPTIVGGRPPEKQSRPGSFSRGIEKVIFLAAVDEDFRKLLLADRQTAIEKCAKELSTSERAVLASIPADQFGAVIERTEVPEPARRSVLTGIAKGVGVLAILGSILAGASCSPDPVKGTRPDREYVERTETEKSEKDAPSDA